MNSPQRTPSTRPDDIVILGAARTPIGSFQGALSGLAAPALGAAAMKQALQHAGIAGHQIDEVIMGQVLSAGVGQAPTRQASRTAGIADHVPCTGISKVCGSGMKAVMLAADQIRAGSIGIAVAGGMESMSNSPYLLPKARAGMRLGHTECLDHMFLDGLQDAEEGRLMGHYADVNAATDGITREQMDAYTLRSLERAKAAQQSGDARTEMTPLVVTERGRESTVHDDELPQQARPDKIPLLKPAFGPNGAITAANASSISDGAAALVISSAQHATQLQAGQPIARLCAHASHAEHPSRFTHAPIGAIERVLNKTGWTLNDVDVFEVNEAFAMVALACINHLKIDPDKLNILGGACALGHPIGASGARILVTLLNALQLRGGRRGIASLCIGGGEATAIAVERL